MDYEVRLPYFEGPFDLLLFFIERDELDIQEVSLAAITGDFLEYIHQMNVLNLDLASEFIWVAATLMKIKARLLLPRPKTESELEEPNAEFNLMQRLIEYRKFKNIIPHLQALEEERAMLYNRGNIPFEMQRLEAWARENPSLEELQNLTLFNILNSYIRVLERNRKKEETPVHEIEMVPYTIEQQKKDILDLIRLGKQIDFHQIQKQSKNKLQLVYSFLAILELVQEKILDIQTGMGLNNFWVSKAKPLQ